AWQQLASACDGATDLSAGDTANVTEAVKLLGAARNAHARRGEWFAVARLIELERSEEHTSELQSREKLVCRLLLEKKTTTRRRSRRFTACCKKNSPPPRNTRGRW